MDFRVNQRGDILTVAANIKWGQDRLLKEVRLLNDHKVAGAEFPGTEITVAPASYHRMYCHINYGAVNVALLLLCC